MQDINLEEILRNIRNLPEVISESKKAIPLLKAYGESGAGLIKLQINGEKKIIKLQIDNSLMEEEKKILEELIIEASINANKRMDILIRKELNKISKELGVPDYLLSLLPLIASK